VSYVIENRYPTLRAFPDLLSGVRVRKVDQYGTQLHEALVAIALAASADPQIVLLSPGFYNAAYFEHVSCEARPSHGLGQVPVWHSRSHEVEAALHASCGPSPGAQKLVWRTRFKRCQRMGSRRRS
jgi:hypothetical protein